jgi:predicted ATPase/DNA-binding CsgD family transcriptional regulator
MAAMTAGAGNLPEAVTAFVGRRSELGGVKNALALARLVTLTGPGGVGKTRLALQVAAEVRRTFSGGVWFVDLSDMSDPALVPSVAAAAIGLSDETTRSPVALLSDFFADKQALLVLDNCEHVLEACAKLTDQLLRSARELRILATSRQVLGTPAEAAFPVPPLSFPGPGRVHPSDLVKFDAVSLFLERASNVLPGFELDDQNAQAVADVCSRLDGLPLAIEMAATRLRALSPPQILERLDERYALLSVGSRASQPRQRSLQSLVDWSYDLCSPTERLLWARSSVFSGGFDLAAAEAVCSGGALGSEAVLDAVIGLAEKSVISREENHTEVRFRMIETILDYGRRRLAESSEMRTVQERHRDYFGAMVDDALPGWFGPREPQLRRTIRTNMANIRGALDFCLSDERQAQAGLRIAGSLWYGWRAIGMVGEGRRWLARMLEVAPEETPTRARALWAEAGLAVFQGDRAAALPRLREADALARKLEDETALGYVRLYEGQLAMADGDMERATELLEEALSSHERLGDPLGVALTLIRLSIAFSALGQVDEAGDLVEKYLTIARAHGSEAAVALANWALSVLMWQKGDGAEAARLAEVAISSSWSVRDLTGVGRGMEVLAWASAAEGKAERSARLLGAAASLRSTSGGQSFGYEHLVTYNDKSSAIARGAIGDERYQASFNDGAYSTTEDNIAFALGLPRRGSKATKPSQPAGGETLSKRELQVAELVAQGLSNREIASSLVISQRTAEAHVEHILVKLGFSSRAQVAVWKRERDREIST